MKVYRSLGEAAAEFRPCAITIGNFDGVHRGHRHILRRVAELARVRGWNSGVLTFDPHPTRVVAPDRTPPLLTLPDERPLLMGEEGVEKVLILPFTPELAALQPREFARKLLADSLGARAVLVGANFRFGHRQAGDVQALADFGREMGFETQVVEPVHWRGRMVSSSEVRRLIERGDVSLAARYLTHPYWVEGKVVSGRGVGSKQTVPTLNLETSADVIPARGVYITRTWDLESSRRWDSITNIGYRPTFGASDQLSIETFLLDPLEGAAPERIRVEFLRRVRDERQFPTPDDLRAQILKDVRTARSYFRRTAAWTSRPCISS